MVSDRISRALREQNGLQESFPLQAEALADFVGRIVDTFHQGGRLLIIGSGALGTIANLLASHFLHKLSLERPVLPVISICHDLALLASLERDGLSRQYLSRQLQVMATATDVVFALAGSSRDEALEEALATARQTGCATAVLRAGGDDVPGDLPDYLFRLTTESEPRALEGALFFGHLLCELIEGELFGT